MLRPPGGQLQRIAAEDLDRDRRDDQADVGELLGEGLLEGRLGLRLGLVVGVGRERVDGQRHLPGDQRPQAETRERETDAARAARHDCAGAVAEAEPVVVAPKPAPVKAAPVKAAPAKAAPPLELTTRMRRNRRDGWTRRLVADPVAVIVAVREGESSLLDGAGLPTLQLTGLDLAAAAALLAGQLGAPVRPGLADRLHRETGGNPLALIELAGDHELADDSPPGTPIAVGKSVAHSYLLRYRSLPPSAREILAEVVAGVRASAAPVPTTTRLWARSSRPRAGRPTIRSRRYDNLYHVGASSHPGGGVPIVVRDGRACGVEAVVDKDLTASLLARELDADALLLLTDVAAVQDGYGTPQARPIRRATPDELRKHDFPAGSMAIPTGRGGSSGEPPGARWWRRSSRSCCSGRCASGSLASRSRS